MTFYQVMAEDGSLKAKIDMKDFNHDLFKVRAGTPSLQASRVWENGCQDGATKASLELQKGVVDSSQISDLRNNSSDWLQIFSVSQERTWTTLDTSRGIFEDFLEAYNVFPEFWRCAFTFGRKSEENEFEFPGFRAKRTRKKIPACDDECELAFVLRRVELNGRELTEGQKPWSIRQTAVYHKIGSPRSSTKSSSNNDESTNLKRRSTFLLLAPSDNFQKQIGKYLTANVPSGDISPWEVHRQLIAESSEGWIDYMVYLEEQMREESDKIVFAAVGEERENLAPLTEFNVNFTDRQTLKLLEDAVIDLQIILSTSLSNILGIRDQCRKSIRGNGMDCDDRNTAEFMIEDFDEFINVARTHIERVKVLRDRATALAQLLSDLLSYEEAVALKELSRESYKEGKEMHRLTERSTKDSAAVKILTVITLIYLPTTIVANFFSTQFVQTSDDGHMKLSGNAWLLAAISIPLTVLTIAIWAIWVFLTKVTPLPISEQPTPPSILRRTSFRAVLSWKKDRQPRCLTPPKQPPMALKKIFASRISRHRDVELGLSTTALRPTNVSLPQPATTWSSGTTIR